MNERHFQLKRALLRALEECGAYAVTETPLVEAARLKVDHLRPTVAECDAALRDIETARLGVAVPSERGRKWKLTDAGRLWLAENA